MTDADLLAEAAAELYAGDPAAFTERRGALAAEARAAGQAAAAKQITALRKPTYSAWLVNQLVRADPEVASQLSQLGGELRSAGAALDGARIRELSQQRRRLVDDLVREALQLPGAGPPSAAVREELTATFGAALADPQVADQLAAGTLVRAVHRSDFTPAGPGLTLVPPLPADRPSRSASRTPVPPTGRTGTRPRGAGQAAAGAAASARAGQAGRDRPSGATAAGRGRQPAITGAGRDGQRTTAAAARERQRTAAAAERDRQRAERERRRQQAEQERQRAIAEAEQAVAAAAQAESAAAAAERDQRAVVRHLEDQLSEAKQQLTEARRQARKAAETERLARRALGRLRN
jgi:hypothetical protein